MGRARMALALSPNKLAKPAAPIGAAPTRLPAIHSPAVGAPRKVRNCVLSAARAASTDVCSALPAIGAYGDPATVVVPYAAARAPDTAPARVTNAVAAGRLALIAAHDASVLPMHRVSSPASVIAAADTEETRISFCCCAPANAAPGLNPIVAW